MKNIIRYAHRHLTGHLNDHSHHYLFGLFGGFAVFKLFLLLMGITIVPYVVITNAQLETGCTMTGQYYTGEYQTGCYEVPEELTGGYMIDCEIIPGYRTGGSLNESGDLVDQIWIEEVETGCVLTGETIVPVYTTGCYLTGGYWTGGTEICDSEEDGLDGLGDGLEEMCESGDVTWMGPLSGSQVRDVFGISWNYSGCVFSGITLQLRDHNEQWIALAELDSGAKNYSFDSKKLYSFQQSGLYHIIGTNMSGHDYYLYTGTYTGEYSHFFTGYQLRLVSSDDSVLYESDLFAIDNQAPTLSGVMLTTNSLITGFVGVSGAVTLSFTASEELTGVVVTLGSGKVPLNSSVSGLVYTYMWNVNSLYIEGPLVANLVFADLAGNTGALVYTSAIVFDMTAPNVTGFSFVSIASGAQLNFTTSEPVRVDFNYQDDIDIVTGMVSEYLTTHQLVFATIEPNQLYIFGLVLSDRAGNSRAVTGDFIQTSFGQIVSNVYIVPLATEEVVEVEAESLMSMLKKELEKYTACKEAINYTPVELEIGGNIFFLQMPDFRKSQVRTLVNAFTLFVLNQVRNTPDISTEDVYYINKKFDSFLVILKLLRDDDNICKQNLSNYHMSQFARALQEYEITIE